MIETCFLPGPYDSQPCRIDLYLPQQAQNTNARFPVLYLFDGQEVFFDEVARFGASWRLGEFLDLNHTPLIVVAVASPESADARLDAYAPYAFQHKRFGSHEGRGPQTMDWYVHTLKPVIDARYPTLPQREHTYLLGCSMGGLMSLYGLLAYNDVFHGAAALSPSLWAAPDRMRQLIRTAPLSPDSILYLDYGQKELKQHKGMEQLFPDFTRALLSRRVLVTQRIIPGGTHSSESWKRQLPAVLFTLLYDEMIKTQT